jgi:hypothetical protein
MRFGNPPKLSRVRILSTARHRQGQLNPEGRLHHH